MTITRESLLTLEAYAKIRKTDRPAVIAHRRLRSVHLGEHMTLQFEDEQTIRRQIQEMLHIEKIFDEQGIQAEIDAYAPLVPDGSNWKATMLIEYPDPNERKRELARLIGVEDSMFVEVEGHARVYAIADEDLERENEEKTSSVHFLRFELTPAAREAVRAGAGVKLGCDHTNYPTHLAIPPDTLASLAGDLRWAPELYRAASSTYKGLRASPWALEEAMALLDDAPVTCLLPVKDLTRARSFYEQYLGLTPLGARPDGKFIYRAGGTELALFPKPEGTKAEHTAVSFKVPDIGRAVAELQARGVAFADYDLPGLKTVDHVCVLGSEKAAWFEDTEGNILCLHEDIG